MAFEIHPDICAGGVETISYLESMGYRDVERIYERIRSRGHEVGITIGPVPRKYNTHLSLLLSEYAKDQEKLKEYNSAVFKAFWSEGKDISSSAVLEEIMAQIGLDFSLGMGGVENGEYELRFQEELNLALQLGIKSVPAFIFADKYLVSGAQPVEVFRRVLLEITS